MTTLTVDGSDTPVELNADEQESLAIGEEMQQSEQQLLAGKYKSPEDLESAYLELQKKLGESSTKEEAESSEETNEESKADFLDTLWDESQSEFTPETLKKLEEMSPRDLAEMHLQYRSKNNNAPQEFSQKTVDQLQGVVGGADNYSKMIKWADQNLDSREVEMFDSVMDTGNPSAAYFAITSLAQRYQDAIGFDGKMLSGKASSSTKTKGFKSQAELVAAMNDPRYENDPAYRQELMTQLENSDIDF